MGWLNWLQGKKTYIIMVFAFVFNLGVIAGWWMPDNTWWAFINSVFAFLGLGTLRAGVSTEAKKNSK